jgi:hypothetical protein
MESPLRVLRRLDKKRRSPKTNIVKKMSIADDEIDLIIMVAMMSLLGIIILIKLILLFI